jgi:hypothetical protein
LQELQDDARAFRRRLLGVDHWDHHQELVEENNRYVWAVDRAVVAYQAAERDCANAIENLIGGATFHADGEPKTDPRAYGVASIPDQAATPWGAPAKTRKSCMAASLTVVAALNPGLEWQTKLDMFRGEFSAATGMLEGLAALTPALGWDRFERTWDGVATLDGLHGPSAMMRAYAGMAKSTVDWDEWATDPARAVGNTGVNVVSVAVPFAGEVSVLADVGRAGRAAELADEAARLSKAGTTVESAARAQEFARLAKLGQAVDPELLGRMPKANDLDNVLQQKFGDLSSAKSPVNSLEHEMAGGGTVRPEMVSAPSDRSPSGGSGGGRGLHPPNTRSVIDPPPHVGTGPGQANIGHAARHQYPEVGRKKSQFFDGINLEELANTEGRIGVMQENGRVRFEMTAKSDVGVDISTGLPTNRYTVIKETDGVTITMYPGLSVRK